MSQSLAIVKGTVHCPLQANKGQDASVINQSHTSMPMALSPFLRVTFLIVIARGLPHQRYIPVLLCYIAPCHCFILQKCSNKLVSYHTSQK